MALIPETLLHRLQHGCSHTVGWLADRRVPTFLRSFLYRGFARFTGANIDEVRPPIDSYPSLGAFFVRELVAGARPIDQDEDALVSPVDGRVTHVQRIENGSVLEAKGRTYELRDFLAGVGADIDFDGGLAWTLYLSPRDYHRFHSPVRCRLVEVAWKGGMLWSVQPSVLEKHPVLAVNERVIMRLETERGPLMMVAVGALNVGRIRIVGVQPGVSGPLARPKEIERGDYVGRFELGSTIVLITPPGMAVPLDELQPGVALRVGECIGRYGAEDGSPA